MPSPYLLLTEVAEVTRAPLSSVRHWIKIGKLPSKRVGRRRLVHRRDLKIFLGITSAEPTAEVKAS